MINHVVDRLSTQTLTSYRRVLYLMRHCCLLVDRGSGSGYPHGHNTQTRRGWGGLMKVPPATTIVGCRAGRRMYGQSNAPFKSARVPPFLQSFVRGAIDLSGCILVAMKQGVFSILQNVRDRA